MHKKTGNHIFSTDFRSFSASTRGRGRPVDDPAKPERRPSRQARPNLSKPDELSGKIRSERPREGAACLWHAFSADRSEAETEPFEARRASNKKSGWGMKCLIRFFSSNVHERIRTSDLPLRRRSLYPAELRGRIAYLIYHELI